MDILYALVVLLVAIIVGIYEWIVQPVCSYYGAAESAQPVVATRDLEHEYRRYTYVSRILECCVAGGSGRTIYEAKNIVERWLLSMVNFSDNMADPVFSYDVLDPDCRFNIQMRDELTSKTRHSPAEAQGIVDRVLAIAREYIDICDTDAGTDAEYTVSEDGLFTYRDYSRRIAPKRMQLLLSMSGPYEVARMLLRYAAILPGAQHWNMPRENYQLYYDRGVRIEGFASPINAQLVTIDRECSYCSLFPDVDAPFGSIGNFFTTSFAGKSVAVGPPYTVELFDRISRKLETECEEAIKTEQSVSFYVTFAAWTDTSGYKRILTSKWCRYACFLPPGSHYYVDTNNPAEPKVAATFTTVFFAVTTRPQQLDYAPMLDAMSYGGQVQVEVVKRDGEIVDEVRAFSPSKHLSRAAQGLRTLPTEKKMKAPPPST